MKSIKYITLFFLFFIAPIPSIADWPENKLDFALLPPYCIAQRHPEWAQPGEPKKWKNKLPGSFPHLHHFCAALHSLRLAKEIIPINKQQIQNRNHQLHDAMTNIDYMERMASPNSNLFGHIHTVKAEILFESNKPKEAIEYIFKAIEANKRFVEPYRILSDYYVKQGKTKEAIDILNQGLQNSPKSKLLNKKLNAIKK